MKRLFFLFIFTLISFHLFSQNKVKSQSYQSSQNTVSYIQLVQWTLMNGLDGNPLPVCSGCANLYFSVYRSQLKIPVNNNQGDYRYRFIFYFSSASYWPNGNQASTLVEDLSFYYNGKEIKYTEWVVVGYDQKTMYQVDFYSQYPNFNVYVNFIFQNLSIQ